MPYGRKALHLLLRHRSDNLYVLSSVELTSVLVVVPSHRLRITALLSSGCKATVEGLPNVHGYSTTQIVEFHVLPTPFALGAREAFSFKVYSNYR